MPPLRKGEAVKDQITGNYAKIIDIDKANTEVKIHQSVMGKTWRRKMHDVESADHLQGANKRIHQP